MRSVRGFEGTLAYMAPEQEDDPTISNKETDAYQIGLIFNELLFQTRRIAPEAPHALRMDIDKKTTEKILRALLATDPSNPRPVYQACRDRHETEHATQHINHKPAPYSNYIKCKN